MEQKDRRCGHATSLRCLIMVGVTLTPAGLTCASVPMFVEHQQPFAFTQNSGTSLTFAAFDDHDGARQLQMVTFRVDATIQAELALTNLADHPVDTDVHVMETLVAQLPELDLAPFPVVDVDTVVSCGAGYVLPPGETCDYGGPLVFEGQFATSTSNGSTLANFQAEGVTVALEGSGDLSYDGDLFAWVISHHAVSGEATLVYHFTATTADACAADLDASESVGFEDLVTLLVAWGSCDGCPADLDHSGEVDASDLILLMSAWGSCSND